MPTKSKDNLDKLVDCIVSHLGCSKDLVTASANFIDDLGADSLDEVELVMAVEEEFGIMIPEEDSEKIKTVGDYIKHLRENQKIEIDDLPN